jgi:hypothetical protein
MAQFQGQLLGLEQEPELLVSNSEDLEMSRRV